MSLTESQTEISGKWKDRLKTYTLNQFLAIRQRLLRMNILQAGFSHFYRLTKRNIIS
jgi:hypothetical protein